ncbi:MAG: tetratricopeptide repeat protein, partial [bacterium]
MTAKIRLALLALAVAAAARAGEADSLFNLANGYMARKEYELAADHYKRVIEADPAYAKAALARY